MKRYLLIIFFILLYSCENQFSSSDDQKIVQYDVGNIYRIIHQNFIVSQDTFFLDSTYFEHQEITIDTIINGNKYFKFESDIHDYKRYLGVSGNVITYAYTEGLEFIESTYFDYSLGIGEILSDGNTNYKITDVRTEMVFGELVKVYTREYIGGGMYESIDNFATKFGNISSYNIGDFPIRMSTRELVGAIIRNKVYGDIHQ